MNGSGCPGFINPTNNSVCTAPTPENTAATCGDTIDNDQDGNIDCADTDCAGLGPCGLENTDAKCSDNIDNDGDGATDCADTDCKGHGVCAPLAWTCSVLFYNDGADCDCGCGVLDPDCASAAVASCGFCADIGSCSSNSCPGTINPTNNAICP